MYDFEEQTIRDVVTAPYGQVCIDAFFAKLRDAGQVTVHRQDDTITTVTTEAEARDLLMAFGWTPSL